MNANLKKFFRTAQTYFPGLLDAKFALMRRVRKARGAVFDSDFAGIRMFPHAEDTLFLDVGGNRGQSTDAILMMSAGRVQLFEPNKLLCSRLKRQFRGNTRVTINECGLGDKQCEQPLYVPFYGRWMFDGLASFDIEKAGNWLEGRVFFYRKERLTIQQVQCRIRRLDDLNLVPFFIKVDVQGYEYQVLKGGERTIRAHEPVLLIEAPPEEDVTAFLKNLGYDFYTFTEGKFLQGVVCSNNTYFLTDKNAALVDTHIVRRDGRSRTEFPSDPIPR